MRRIRSPRLARLVDSGVAGNWLYLVQEYVPGVTLSDLIKRASPLPAREGLRVALELLEAIADVHEADVVHRDVKPLNVVIGNNRVTLVDLGIAKHATDGGVTTTEQICGTLRYMSPEQAVGDAPGKPSDIFSWGLTVAEALQGYHPIDPGHRLLSDWSAYRRALHRCRPDLTHVPPAVQPWIARALAAAPEHRPTVHELLAGLEPLHSPASSPSGTLLISSRQGARSRSLRKTVTRWRDVILEAAESRIADRPAWFAASLAVAALLGAPAGVVVRVIWTTAMGN
jgi:serine/threonine protein kinase